MYDMPKRYREAILQTHVPVVRVRALYDVQFGAQPAGGRDIAIVSGNVKMNSSQDVKSSLDLTVPGFHWGNLLPYGVELFPERGIDYGDGTQDWVPLGYFRVEEINQDDAPLGTIKVTAKDRISRLREHRVLYPYSYPAGTTHREIFEKLVNGFRLVDADEGTTVIFPMYHGRTVPIRFIGYDGDRATLPAGVVEDFAYDFLAKIASQKNCVIRANRLGGLDVDLSERTPNTPSVYTIRPGENGNLIKVSRKLSRDKTYNVVDAYGSDPAYPTGYGFYTLDNPASPLFYRGPFQATVRKFASPLLRNNDQVLSAALSLLGHYRYLPSGVSAVTLPDATLDPMDVLTILSPSAAGNEIADEITIPLDIGSPVAVTTRAQNEITDEISDDGSGDTTLFNAAFRDSRAYPDVRQGSGAGTPVSVSTSAQLTAALASAAAGHVITLADGVYTGTFTVNKKGTSAQPIVIKAANVGGAAFTSGSKLTLQGAEWVLVSGLTAPYDDEGTTFGMLGACKFCRFTRCTFGPTFGPTMADTWKLGFSSGINNALGASSAAFDRAATMGLDAWYNAGDSWHKDGSSPNWSADWTAAFASTGYAALLASLKRRKHWVNVSDHDGYANDAPATSFGSGFQTAYRSKFASVASQLPVSGGGIYRTWAEGRIGFIQLDQRSFRSLKSATDNSSKTMLGAAQKAWFKTLIRSNAFPLWVILGDVPIHAPTEAGADHWGGYNTERVELQAELDASSSKFLYLHGDQNALSRKANAYGYDLALGAGPLLNNTDVLAAGANLDASFPTAGAAGPAAQLFGVVTFTDNRTTITASFAGYDHGGNLKLSTSLSVTAPVPAATSATTPQGSFIRIDDQSEDCVVDHCEFRNKTRPGNAITVDGDTAVAGNAGGCKHILISHNLFRDFATEVDNGFETIRFGVSGLSRTPSNSAIIRNVFTNIVTEPELVSVKMGRVDVRGNSVLNCAGTLCQRHGTEGAFTHNHFGGGVTGTAGTKSGGVRIYDAGHDVSENYFVGLNGTGFQGTIVVDGGDAGTDLALTAHWPVRNAKINKNQIIACATGVLIGPNYTVAPDSIAAVDNYVVETNHGSAGQIVKTPTGASVLTPNTYVSTVAAAGLTVGADGIARRAGSGSRLTALLPPDVGVRGDLGETDGTGRSLATGAGGSTPGGGGGTPSDPGGGTPPPTGTPATSVANLLKIGKPSGFNKVNIGIGYPSGHKDHSLAEIENGLSVPGFFELTSDKLRAKLSVPLNGGRTSSNTKYPRVEFRGLKNDGTSKQSFDPNKSGTAKVYCRTRVIKVPPNKPQLCLCQWHDASDDTAMIYMKDKKTIIAKDGDTVVGTLESNFQFGVDYVFGIDIVGDGSKSKLRYYWGTSSAALTTPKLTSANTSRATGWYGKAGNYAQSNSDTDSTSDGPFIIEMSALLLYDPSMPAPVGFGTW